MFFIIKSHVPRFLNRGALALDFNIFNGSYDELMQLTLPEPKTIEEEDGFSSCHILFCVLKSILYTKSLALYEKCRTFAAAKKY